MPGKSQQILSWEEYELSLANAVEQFLPRVLTQVCRDPNSPTFGSFDRNWWHYKIRDFSSIIVQQGGYCLSEAAVFQKTKEETLAFRQLAKASAIFWNIRAKHRGAFEEYYPWEQGYPPLAFSTLAIAKMVKSGEVDLADVREGLVVAVSQLGSRFEAQAGNQQIAGLAAFAAVGALDQALIQGFDFDALASRSLKLQNEEGWYEEYDGPDLGYLAVTIDCLWDLYDATGEARFLESAKKALQLIHKVVLWVEGSPGMLNARNTDYLVPYGITRFAVESDNEVSLQAKEILSVLFDDLASSSHFLKAIDDRYICHYVGHSFVRALNLLKEHSGQGPLVAEFSRLEKDILPNCGYHLVGTRGAKGLVAALKGGVFLWKDGPARIADYGWLVLEGDTTSVSHWWSKEWSVEETKGGLRVSGTLFSHQGAQSSPLKHMVLRVLSFTCGSKIIGFLKSKLIFKNASGNIRYQRLIQISDEKLLIQDSFEGHETDARFVRAPRSSKRHVSSADSFHIEDLNLFEGFHQEEKVISGEKHLIETVYRRVE